MASNAQSYTESYHAHHTWSHSFAESWLATITNHRNMPIVENKDSVSQITSKVVSGACYIGVLPVIVAEIGLATISSVGSMLMYTETTEPLERSVAWLKSCSFGISWAVAAFVLNCSSEVLPTDQDMMWKVIEDIKLHQAMHGSVED